MGILNRIKKFKQEDTSLQNKEAAEKSLPSKTSIKARLSGVIIQPLVSEKAAVLAGSNQYVFVVAKGVNRLQVRSAIRQMYNVSPLSVNIVNVRGKEVRFGSRTGKRSDWKKAIVTLPKDQSINVYEGV